MKRFQASPPSMMTNVFPRWAVDGQGSTGTEIAGNNVVVNQDGTLDVSGGGHGIDITGDSATEIGRAHV